MFVYQRSIYLQYLTYYLPTEEFYNQKIVLPFLNFCLCKLNIYSHVLHSNICFFFNRHDSFFLSFSFLFTLIQLKIGFESSWMATLVPYDITLNMNFFLLLFSPLVIAPCSSTNIATNWGCHK